MEERAFPPVQPTQLCVYNAYAQPSSPPDCEPYSPSYEQPSKPIAAVPPLRECEPYSALAGKAHDAKPHSAPRA